MERTGEEYPSIRPEAMQAMCLHKDFQADILAQLSVLPVLPFSIHVSPFYVMVSRSVDGNETHRKQFISSLTVITILLQFIHYYMEVNKHAEIHKTGAGKQETESDRLSAIYNLYIAEQKKLESKLHDELNEQIYLKCSQQQSIIGAEQPFIARLEKHTFDYIHLLECVLHKCSKCKIPVACVLTPLIKGNEPPTTGEQSAIGKFFQVNNGAINKGLISTKNEHLTREDWFPNLHTVQPLQWYNEQLLLDYFKFMDTESTLTFLK
jgi:hypothetical protein